MSILSIFNDNYLFLMIYSATTKVSRAAYIDEKYAQNLISAKFSRLA